MYYTTLHYMHYTIVYVYILVFNNYRTEKKIRLKLIGKSIQKVTNGYYRSL